MSNQYVRFTDACGQDVYGESDYTHIEQTDGSAAFKARGSLALEDGHLHDWWYFNHMETVEPEDLPSEVAERFGVGGPDIVEEVRACVMNVTKVELADDTDVFPESVKVTSFEGISPLTYSELDNLEDAGFRVCHVAGNNTVYVCRRGDDE